MLNRKNRIRTCFNIFLVMGLFLVASTDSLACLAIKNGQTGAESGNPIGSFGEEVVIGANTWCSTGGSFDNPVGCLQSCSNGCKLSWQKEQCNGSDLNPPGSCGAGKFAFNPSDPNCTRWGGCAPGTARDCSTLAGSYTQQCCGCPTKVNPRWQTLTYAEQLQCDPTTPSPVPGPSPVPSSVPSPGPLPSSSPLPPNCELDPLDPNLASACVCKAGYTPALVTAAPSASPTPVPSGTCTSTTTDCGSNTMSTCWMTQKSYTCGSGSSKPGFTYYGKIDCACPGEYSYPNPICGLACPLGK